MAIDIATARSEVAKIYIAAFNRVPDSAGLAFWVSAYMNGSTLASIADGFASSQEYANTYPAYLTNTEYVSNIYTNVFGRAADATGLAFWSDAITNGVVTKAALLNSMITAAGGTGNNDGLKLANQATFAVNAVVNNLDQATATAQLANITFDAATITTATTAVTTAATGTSYALTLGVDTITGTTGNDTINAVVDGTTADNNTFTSLDSINGGTGADVLNILNTSAANADALDLSVATISNVETINIRAVGDVSAASGSNTAGTDEVDFSSTSGLTTINTTQSVNTLVKAASTTDVNVSGATGLVSVLGGKNVSVSDATTANAITVGDASAVAGDPAGTITVTDTDNSGGGNDITITGGTTVTVVASAEAATGDIIVGHATNGTATGAVSVTQNILDDGAAGINNSALPITVTGGSTVTVNVNGTSTADAATDSGNLQLSATTVVGDGETTAVTVTQTKDINVFTAATVAAVNEKTTVTFSAMASGETVVLTDSVNTLTFTASKALTAAEVAEAFAGLTTSDRQDAGGKTANGIYTGQFSTVWASAAASGATVVFTATSNAENDIAFTGTTATTPTQVKVAGTAASGGTFSAGAVTYGTVRVDDVAAESITTVTLDGYLSADLGKTGTNLDALTTLSLTNSAGAAELETGSTTLALTVNNVNHNVEIDEAATAIDTLNITATGTESAFTLIAADVTDLTINAAVDLDISGSTMSTVLETVDVNGAGAVNLGNISGAVTLNTFDASGNTGGVTATVETEIDASVITGDITEYVFSEGNDVVTLSNDVIETIITLGAGDDKLTLAAATGIADVVATLNGGTGTNIIDMAAADAEILSGDATFETKMSNFSKLSLGQVANDADNTVNLANMDDISYVISAGTSDTAQVITCTITGSTDNAADTVTIVVDGVTYTSAAGIRANGAAITAALVTAINAGTGAVTATDVAGVLTLTADNAGTAFTVGAITGVTGGGAADTVTKVDAITSSELFLTNMANNGTLELTAAGVGATVTMTDATSTTADIFNILTGDAAGNVGTVAVAGVETVNVTTTDTFTDTTGALDGNGGAIADGVDDANSTATLVVSDSSAITVNVYGAGDLTLDTNSTALTAVNASTMTGALTYTADGKSTGTTVTGGLGADALTASGSSDTLIGGAGNDTLTGANLTTLTGGAGNDTFMMNVPTSVNAYSTITDLTSGDTIDFGAATTVVFTAAAITLADTAVFQDYANAATNALGTDGDNVAWFQFGTNTYIIKSGDTTANDFQSGVDGIIKITGLVDLSTASYNQTTATLEIA